MRARPILFLLETTLFIVTAVALVIVLFGLQPTMSGYYWYEGKDAHATTLPLVVTTESKIMHLSVSFALPKLFSTWFVLKPDDCIEDMRVNGRKVPNNVANMCNATPGKRVDLGAYLHEGTNTIEWVIRDTGGTGGLELPLSWMDPLFLSLFALLVLLIGWNGFWVIMYFIPKNDRKWAALFLILLAGFVIRFAASKHGGYEYDVHLNQNWAHSAVMLGMGPSYNRQIGDAALPNYPPFSLMVFAATGSLYELLLSPSYEMHSAAYDIMIRMPAIFADLATCVVLFFLCAKMFSQKKGLIAAAIYSFNIPVWYDSAVWGQTDSLYTLLICTALLSILNKQWFLTGVLVALGLLTKLQAVILLPVVGLVFLAERRAWWRFPAGALGCASVVLFPFFLSHTMGNVINVYRHSVGFFSSLTMGAYNFWVALFGSQASEWGDTKLLWGISFRWIGLILFFSVTACILLLFWRGVQRGVHQKKYAPMLMLTAGLIAYAFFLFNTEMHERYLFPYMALGLPLVFLGTEGAALYILSSILYLGNLMGVLPFNDFFRTVYDEFQGLNVFIASAQLFVFASSVLLLYRYRRRIENAGAKNGMMRKKRTFFLPLHFPRS